MYMKFLTTINDFSGPLDLLLHLVRASEMDIYEVPIEEITNQYVEYINKMEEMNIDVASEYLILASELIYIKSKKLLNIKDDDEEEANQLEFKIGTEEELRHRLIEYKKYKEITESFKMLEERRSDFHTKLPESLSEYRESVSLNTDITLDDLMNAFEEFLKRQKYSKPLATKITSKEYSVSRRTFEIRNLLKKQKEINFFDLFEEVNKPYIVVTFLTILEMTKSGEINIKQDKTFGNITIESRVS